MEGKETMEAILTGCVQKNLRHFMHRNAIFMCERLCAEFPSEVNLQLLASCYLQNNQAYCAYHILKGTQMAQSRYLFAISCFQMDLLNEAEAALCRPNEPEAALCRPNEPDLLNEAEAALCRPNEPSPKVPNGAAGHYLLGLIYRCTGRRRNAIHHFKKALSDDPLMWVAYEELCALGDAEEAAVVFGEAAATGIQKQYAYQGSVAENLHTSNEDHHLNYARSVISAEDPKQQKQLQGSNSKDMLANCQGASGRVAIQSTNGGSAPFSLYNAPSPVAAQSSGITPPPLRINLQQKGRKISSLGADSSPKSTVSPKIQAPRRKSVDEGKISGTQLLFSDSGPRRSSRLASNATANANLNSSVTGKGTSNTSRYLGNPKLGSVAFRSVTVRKGQPWANENCDEGLRNEAIDESHTSVTPETHSCASGDFKSLDNEGGTVPISAAVLNTASVLNGTAELLGLLRIFGEGYRLSCLYRCQDALDVYSKLPHKHYNTAWVLSQVGKAFFELVDYLEADRVFSLSRRAAPYSLEGMDTYSTVLYHLKEDMKLSYLARELISIDRLAPQSWCAMGNCYSLQKDHETALKNFQHAVQLDSKFAYGHTLCGHEYVSLEDYDNGMKSYQSALLADARHYNSWYGLGMIYLRQENFEFSEHHFRMAFQINPCSSIIMSYLGTALHALKRSDEALEMMEKAILADKKNPLPMYQKANILVSLEDFDEALEVLEELKECNPRESSIYALMGRIYKQRNMHDKAMLHYSLALDLKPPATDVATIKEAREKLHVLYEVEDCL